ERGVRDLLAFFGNAHFFPECGFGAPGAQLNVNAGDKLTGIDGTRNGIVGADIERGGAFGGRGTDDENHADGFRRDCTSDGRYGFSRDRVRQACVEYEHIGVRVLDGVEAFGGGGERSEVISRPIQRRAGEVDATSYPAVSKAVRRSSALETSDSMMMIFSRFAFIGCGDREIFRT